MKKTGRVMALLAAGTLATACVGVAAGGQSPAERSLDQQLLDELSVDPLNELDRELFAPGQGEAEPPAERGDEPDDLGARLRRELGAAAVAEEDNPLLEVGRQMREVQGRIAGNDSGSATQEIQGRIITGLDELIKRACKACQGGGAGSKPSRAGSPGGGRGQGSMRAGEPTERPATTSSQRPRDDQDRTMDREAVQAMMQQLWEVGLPAQQRDQLLQSPPEEFLPQYELLIEQYFRRLSEGEQW